MYDFSCCRVCLSYNNLILIFNNDTTSKISDKIAYVIGKEISEQAGLPNKICLKCLQYLNIAYSFKTVYETTNLKLLELLKRGTGHTKVNLNEENIETVIVEKAVDKSENIIEEIPINDKLTSNVTFSDETFIDNLDNVNEVLVYTETVDNTPPEDNLKLSDKLETKLDKIGRHTARKNSNTHPRKLKFSEGITNKKICESRLEFENCEKRLCETVENVKLSNKTEPVVKNDKIKLNILGLTCEICQKAFPFQSHLIRHLNSHNNTQKYKCKQCGKLFANKYNLKSHLRQHTDDYPLRCKKCGRGFSSPSILKRHMLGHSDISHFECRYCMKQMTHRSSLILHEKMHDQHGTLFKCELCSKLFKYKNSLSAHVRKVH